MRKPKPSIFIRNIYKDDILFIQAAEKNGYSIIGNIIDNDENEISNFRTQFPKIKLLLTKTAYQNKISFWTSYLLNHIQVELFRLYNRPSLEFRNSRYVDINFYSVLLGSLVSHLRPYLRFLKSNWDKDLYLKKLAAAQLPVPPIYGVLRDNQEPHEDFFKKLQFPCICKPSSCSGGFGVYHASGPEDIQKLYSYDENLDNLTPLNHFYRNKTSKGVRNYIYNTHTCGGRYLFQKYVKSHTFSISATLVNEQLISAFCYKIHSADNVYFAEQGFSWPIDASIEKQIIKNTILMTKVLGYPDGPLMADFVYDDNGNLSIIDASSRASQSASRLSQFVYGDNWHAECLVLATIKNDFHIAPPRQGRPVFWQRLPLPKGHYEYINYPQFNSDDVLFYNLPIKSGSQVFETRTDRQMIQRGDFATTGKTVEEAKLKWNSLFKAIEWQLKN